MADEAATVVAAFGGALLGAVVQPVVMWIVRRKERSEQRLEQRNAELRLMVEQRLADARQLLASWFSVRAALLVGPQMYRDVAAHVERARQKHGEVEPRTIWRPYRIGDSKLREMCVEVNDRLFELDGKIYGAYLYLLWPSGDPAGLIQRFDTGDIRSAADRVEELLQPITMSMDELNW